MRLHTRLDYRIIYCVSALSPAILIPVFTCRSPSSPCHTVLPITFGCLLGILLLVISASFHPLPKFDPMSVTSLVIASSGGQIHLEQPAMKGADSDDVDANMTQVSFERNSYNGLWGLVEKP